MADLLKEYRYFIPKRTINQRNPDGSVIMDTDGETPLTTTIPASEVYGIFLPPLPTNTTKKYNFGFNGSNLEFQEDSGGFTTKVNNLKDLETWLNLNSSQLPNISLGSMTFGKISSEGKPEEMWLLTDKTIPYTNSLVHSVGAATLVVNNFVIGPNNITYVLSNQGIYYIDPIDDQIKITDINTGTWYFGIIGPNGILYFLGNGGIYYLDTVDNKIKQNGAGNSFTYAVIGANNILYVCSNTNLGIWYLDPSDGTFKISNVSAGNFTFGIVAPNRTTYFLHDTNGIYQQLPVTTTNITQTTINNCGLTSAFLAANNIVYFLSNATSNKGVYQLSGSTLTQTALTSGSFSMGLNSPTKQIFLCGNNNNGIYYFNGTTFVKTNVTTGTYRNAIISTDNILYFLGVGSGNFRCQNNNNYAEINAVPNVTITNLSSCINTSKKTYFGSISDSVGVYYLDQNWRKLVKGFYPSDYIEDTFALKSELISALSGLSWKDPVNTYSELTTKYPHPLDGWTVHINDTDKVYRFTGTAWSEIFSQQVFENATTTTDGLMSKEDKIKLDKIDNNVFITPTISFLNGTNTTVARSNHSHYFGDKSRFLITNAIVNSSVNAMDYTYSGETFSSSFETLPPAAIQLHDVSNTYSDLVITKSINGLLSTSTTSKAIIFNGTELRVQRLTANTAMTGTINPSKVENDIILLDTTNTTTLNNLKVSRLLLYNELNSTITTFDSKNFPISMPIKISDTTAWDSYLKNMTSANSNLHKNKLLLFNNEVHLATTSTVANGSNVNIVTKKLLTSDDRTYYDDSSRYIENNGNNTEYINLTSYAQANSNVFFLPVTVGNFKTYSLIYTVVTGGLTGGTGNIEVIQNLDARFTNLLDRMRASSNKHINDYYVNVKFINLAGSVSLKYFLVTGQATEILNFVTTDFSTNNVIYIKPNSILNFKIHVIVNESGSYRGMILEN
jgi:hypothetical protein